MAVSLESRIAALEKIVFSDRRVCVLYPGDPEPDDPNVEVFLVRYVAANIEDGKNEP